MRMRKTFIWSVLLAGAVVLSPVAATAGGCGKPPCGDELAVIVAGGVAGAVVETLGTIGAVKAGLAASEGHRAPTGWLVMGYLSGLMNLTGAVLVLNASAREDAKTPYFTLGILGIVWGGANLTLAIWSSTRQETPDRGAAAAERKAKLGFSPLLGLGARGGVLAGVSVSLLTF